MGGKEFWKTVEQESEFPRESSPLLLLIARYDLDGFGAELALIRSRSWFSPSLNSTE